MLRPKKEERCPPFEEIIAEQDKRNMEEHVRLLYVALTRAADRLIVSGAKPKEKKDGSDPRPPNCWHRIVEEAMIAFGAKPADEPEWVALRYGSDGATRVRRSKEKIALAPIAVPDWARQQAPPEARPPRPLAPSAIAADDEAAPPPSAAMRAAAQRGIWIHQLLERLPGVGASERPEAARNWLERSAGFIDSAVRDEIVEQVCAILSDRQFSALFGPSSLGEAPLAATLPDGRVIAGTMDRILIEESRISVVDFKTGRVPATDADIPNSHRAQMDAYVAALEVIFPGRDIRAALLYTAGPKLIQVAG
jgi:ATP-dependent helicase/nuclease subunit A